MTSPPYVELRCRSAFSFLSGASLPEDLAARAAELGYTALALSDVGGVYGAPRFHKAAKKAGLQPIVGAEVVIEGHPLLLLCETPAGYRHLCHLITQGKLRGPKGPGLGLSDLEAHAGGLMALTGGAEGLLGAALDCGDGDGAALTLDQLVGIFGSEHLAVEMQVHMDEQQDRRNAALLSLGRRYHVPLVLTNDVHMATPAQADLLDILTCIQTGATLDGTGKRFLRNAERHLKAPAEMARRMQDLPEAVAHTLEIAARCRFTLDELEYRFPDYPLPPDQTTAGFLRAVVEDAAPGRLVPFSEQARRQLDRELALIIKLGMEGYFLIVWDIVRLCRARGILCQGRGSAANSAVCFALGITACDPLRYDLLFERFLSEDRGEWPDIDLDLPSRAHREEVIQYLYKKYGPYGCAMTANVITYRGRSAVRDVGKALAFSPEQLGKLSGLLGGFGGPPSDQSTPAELSSQLKEAGLDPRDTRVRHLCQLCGQIQDLPRHLGQHSGGMVLAAGRLSEVAPLQPATMPGRVVIQWDKEDCADLGLIKIDLLGLGMMALLEHASRLCPRHDGVPFDMAALPPDDPAVYEVLCQADTIGLFQVESRAQMATLPRMKPERFYDLVVEVALIRPGPIVGKLVHPYLRRRNGQEPVRYPHPCLEPILARTLGVPLFQEQVMRMAMVAAGFSGSQAEVLRRAMGFKRSEARMKGLLAELHEGMARQGITGPAADEIASAITSFAQYGFPESHAISFALLSYASAYLKVHHPAVFFASLFNAQPMGFYQPATLVQDAQRHGVRVLPVDVTCSDWDCTIEDQGRPARTMCLGLRYVHGLRQEAARALVQARTEVPFSSLGDLKRRCPALRAAELSTLAEIGAFASLPGHPSRRDALWQMAALAAAGGPLLEGVQDPDDSPLGEMTPAERIQADYRGTSLTVGPHPLALHREALRRAGVVRSVDLAELAHGTHAKVAGCVIVRQRPGAAKGFFFLTLEDETGITNVIVTPQDFSAGRVCLVSAPALVVGGILQKQGSGISLKGQRFAALGERVAAAPSHDFH